MNLLYCFVITITRRKEGFILRYRGTMNRGRISSAIVKRKSIMILLSSMRLTLSKITLKAVTRGESNTNMKKSSSRGKGRRVWKPRQVEKPPCGISNSFCSGWALHTRRRGTGSAFRLLTRLRKYF